MYSFTCFGEVLWDIFTDYEKIGGAPLNVALRLKSFTNTANIISSIGDDVLGNKLKYYIKVNNVTTDYLQINQKFETGKVNVLLDANNSATYEIKLPVAWDSIELTEKNIKLVKQSDVFVFGSLACRSPISKNTLLNLLNYANFKVFDVNLRPPFFSIELLSELMRKADFIKFNEDELDLISLNLNFESNSTEEKMIFISKSFDAKYVCVTRGEKGAILLNDGHIYFNEGYKVVVKDTVGAGDSFLAALLHKITNHSNNQDALNYACAVGALVAGSDGANSAILEKDILSLIEI